mmetsp:Transcript_4359/g.18452  ORF Transcript_4359/g.18452 Transcript_4359/m.18452 type:complete len:233 (-) Transcript_4359:1381-2079(-)
MEEALTRRTGTLATRPLEALSHEVTLPGPRAQSRPEHATAPRAAATGMPAARIRAAPSSHMRGSHRLESRDGSIQAGSSTSSTAELSSATPGVNATTGASMDTSTHECSPASIRGPDSRMAPRPAELRFESICTSGDPLRSSGASASSSRPHTRNRPGRWSTTSALTVADCCHPRAATNGCDDSPSHAVALPPAAQAARVRFFAGGAAAPTCSTEHSSTTAPAAAAGDEANL